MLFIRVDATDTTSTCMKEIDKCSTAVMNAVGFGSFLILFLAARASTQADIKFPCGVNWTQRCTVVGDLTPWGEGGSVRGVKVSLRAVCQPYHPTSTTEHKSDFTQTGSALKYSHSTNDEITDFQSTPKQAHHWPPSSSSSSSSTSPSSPSTFTITSLLWSTTPSSSHQSSLSPQPPPASSTSPTEKPPPSRKTTKSENEPKRSSKSADSRATNGAPINNKGAIHQPQGTPLPDSNTDAKARKKVTGTIVIRDGLITKSYDIKKGTEWKILSKHWQFNQLLFDESHNRLIFTIKQSIGYCLKDIGRLVYQYLHSFGSYNQAALDSGARILFLVGEIKDKIGQYLVQFNTSSEELKGHVVTMNEFVDYTPKDQAKMAINTVDRHLYIVTIETQDEYTVVTRITTYSYEGKIINQIPVPRSRYKIYGLVYDGQGKRLIYSRKDYLYKVNLKTKKVTEIPLAVRTGFIRQLLYSSDTAVLITTSRVFVFDNDWILKKEIKKTMKKTECACLIPEEV